MNKNNKFLMIIMLFLLVFTITGCSCAGGNKEGVTYPLGDTGYIANVIYKLYDSNTVKKVEDVVQQSNEEGSEGEDQPEIIEKILGAGKQYTVGLNAYVNNEKYTGKKIKIEFGTFDNNVFTSLAEGKEFVLGVESTRNFYSFTLPEDIDEKKLVIVIHLGNELDEKISKGSSFSFSDFAIYEGETATNTEVYANINLKNNINQYQGTLTEMVVDTTNTIHQISLTNKSNLWDKLLNLIGILTYSVSTLLGGLYWVGIIITTILVRTTGWPIYAKTNDMSLKMSLAQPEIEKLNQKYANRTDQISIQKKQMEMMQIYKKYKINMWGCLLMLLQMPIFMAVYNTLQRFPHTPRYQDLNFHFLWTDFGAANGLLSGDVWLAVIMAITMIFIQEYQSRKPAVGNLNNKKVQSAQQQKSQKTMRIVSYAMTAMMFFFALTSAGMAFYWIIGNVYQFFQTLITRKLQTRKMEKMRSKTRTLY